jgi:hypothetical protein
MRLRKRRAAFAIAFASILATALPGLTRVIEPALPVTMKPLQGVSFDIGTKRAVSYFLNDDDGCKLTLTLAEVAHDDEVKGLTATRITVAVQPGKAAHLDTAEGKSVQFKCQAGAHVMSVEVLTTAHIGITQNK